MQTDAWGSFQRHWYMNDADILRVEMEEDLHDDSHRLCLYSRYFEYRGSIAFTRMEAPPAQPAVNMAMAALGPLFHAYARMPFTKSVTRPLLQATMDRLLPELYRSITHTLHPLVIRPGHRRLVADRNPPVTNAWLQAENSRVHMDRIEAAFRAAREADDGSLVSLARGEVVRPRSEPELFLDPESFDPAFRRNRTATAREIQMRSQHALSNALDMPAHRHVVGDAMQIFRTAYETQIADLEDAIFFGAGRRGFNREAVERARETLIHCLNPVQRAEFERTNSFTVVAQDNRMYRVLPEDVYNVEDEHYRYCCVPAEPCPVYDKMLASKLWLEAQFYDFMATANKMPKRGGIAPRGPHPRMYFGFDMPIRNPAGMARLLGP